MRSARLGGLSLLLETPAVPIVRLSTPGLFGVASSRGGTRRYTVNATPGAGSCVAARQPRPFSFRGFL